MKSLIKSLVLAILLIACDDNESNEPPVPAGCKRVGSVCNDGRTTTSIASDACKDAGGFKEWLCEK